MQQLQPLRRQLEVQQTYSREVAARLAKAGDQSERDWVTSYFENDRNGCGCCFCCERRRSGDRSNHGHLATNQFGRHFRQSIVFALRPTIFDGHIPALSIAGFTQTLSEG